MVAEWIFSYCYGSIINGLDLLSHYFVHMWSLRVLVSKAIMTMLGNDDGMSFIDSIPIIGSDHSSCPPIEYTAASPGS
jgi:hypothetical protein